MPSGYLCNELSKRMSLTRNTTFSLSVIFKDKSNQFQAIRIGNKGLAWITILLFSVWIVFSRSFVTNPTASSAPLTGWSQPAELLRPVLAAECNQKALDQKKETPPQTLFSYFEKELEDDDTELHKYPSRSAFLSEGPLSSVFKTTHFTFISAQQSFEAYPLQPLYLKIRNLRI